MLINYTIFEDDIRMEDPISYVRVDYYIEELADYIIDYHKKLMP